MPASGPVLVTGAAGFLGGHLLRALLARGEDVHGLDNFDPFYSRRVKEAHLASVGLPPEAFHQLDLGEGAGLRELLTNVAPRAVVHLAAKAGVRPSLEDPVGYYRANLMGTVALADACARAGVPGLVFASSSSVYGENAVGPFREGDGDLGVDRPVSPYAASKRAGELALRTAARLGGPRVLALRFFTVYGPWQRPDLAVHRFARQLRSGEPLTIYGDGSMRRDLTYVGDTVQGILAGLDRVDAGVGEEYEVVNLGCGRPISVLEIVEGLEAALGVEGEKTFLPRPAGDVTLTHADPSRARELLGYTPGTPYEEGVRAFAEWFQEAQDAPWYPA